MKHHNISDYMVIIIFIILTSIVGMAGSYKVMLWDNTSILLFIMSISFIIHWVIFIPSFIFSTEKFYDITGTISFLTTIFITLWIMNNEYGIISTKSIIVSMMVIVWTIRLGGFLFIRINKYGE